MSKKPVTYQRFPLARRIEHIAMVLSFGSAWPNRLTSEIPNI